VVSKILLTDCHKTDRLVSLLQRWQMQWVYKHRVMLVGLYIGGDLKATTLAHNQPSML